MKTKLFYLAVTVLLLFACNSENKPGDKKLKRNTSITKANAYNDLFLDSASFEQYIAKIDTAGNIGGMMRVFYYDRNFEFAWFSSRGLSEQAKGFWNLFTYYGMAANDTTLQNKTLKRKMDALIAKENLQVSEHDKNFIQTELLLTEYFIKYMQQNDHDVEKVQQLECFIPSKKDSVINVAENILKDKNLKVADSKLFSPLRSQIENYVSIAKKGGWQKIDFHGKRLKKGSKADVIKAIKERLSLTGEFKDKNDTSNVYNEGLEDAIKIFQSGLGYNPTGNITDTLIKNLNVPVESRLASLIINSYRLMWLPEEPKGKLIMVNIPEYKLHIFEQNNEVKDMNVVVGKEGSNTVIFSGKLNQIVFSPDWNIPAEIVKNEILPKMQEDPDYLAEQNMEIAGEQNGVPVIKQLAGDDNALGKVKFLFPNRYNIYFHDTPAKSLFEKEQRAYSHGCIRLSDPKGLAEYLLQNNKEWTSEKIDSAMNSGEQKYVALKDNSVPVIITYYTAWVDKNGNLNFRDDIYDHDAKESAKLF